MSVASDVGFVGLGTMGKHMAHNLLKAGNRLVAYDARREAASELTAAGAAWAETPQELKQPFTTCSGDYPR